MFVEICTENKHARHLRREGRTDRLRIQIRVRSGSHQAQFREGANDMPSHGLSALYFFITGHFIIAITRNRRNLTELLFLRVKNYYS